MPTEIVDVRRDRYLDTDPSGPGGYDLHRFRAEESYRVEDLRVEVPARANDMGRRVVAAGAKVAVKWLADLEIFGELRGCGLGPTFVPTIAEHPDVVDIGRHPLATRAAHVLHHTFGYVAIVDADRSADRWTVRHGPS